MLRKHIPFRNSGGNDVCKPNMPQGSRWYAETPNAYQHGAVLVFDGIVSTNAENSRQLNAKNIFARNFRRPAMQLAMAS